MEVSQTLYLCLHFSMSAYPDIRRFFCDRHTHNWLVRTVLSTDAMHGSPTLTPPMLERTSGGHSLPAQLFRLTTAKETMTDISFSRLLITLLG